MHRPYVICHMLPSIDGRIVIRDWKQLARVETLRAALDAAKLDLRELELAEIA